MSPDSDYLAKSKMDVENLRSPLCSMKYLLKKFVIIADRYIREVLEECIVLFGTFIGEKFQLIHDNTQSHKVRLVWEYLELADIVTKGWPGNSRMGEEYFRNHFCSMQYPPKRNVQWR